MNYLAWFKRIEVGMKFRKENLVCQEKYPKERKKNELVQLQISRIISEKKAGKMLSSRTMEK